MAQQAAWEAMAVQSEREAKRLQVIGDLRSAWYRRYVLFKQVEITQANQSLLKSLIDTANARVATGKATTGDVLLGTLEFSNLQETLIGLRQQLVATEAELNRLAGQPSDTPLAIPQVVAPTLPVWEFEELRQLAWRHQPVLETARLRAAASRWGVEVAKLKRRPDLSLNVTTYVMDDNRPPSAIVDVGQDAWSVGASFTIPLWQSKYDAMTQEARWKHLAAHASEEEVRLQVDSMLREQWEQAKAASETIALYQTTLLPQARQTLEADQKSLVNNSVEFDRVIRDFRTLLMLEAGYHRALGQLSTALARIQQTVGQDVFMEGLPKLPSKP